MISLFIDLINDRLQFVLAFAFQIFTKGYLLQVVAERFCYLFYSVKGIREFFCFIFKRIELIPKLIQLYTKVYSGIHIADEERDPFQCSLPPRIFHYLPR